MRGASARPYSSGDGREMTRPGRRGDAAGHRGADRGTVRFCSKENCGERPSPADYRGGGSLASGVPPKTKAGPSSKQVQHSQAIHRNPGAVAAIIKEARDNEDIPTKTAVLKKRPGERFRSCDAPPGRGRPRADLLFKHPLHVFD